MKDRIYYLDHIRVFLTILVLFHHAALPYTPLEGAWYVSDMEQGHTVASSLLSFFIAINQAFFMGFFFFLSGCFTPSAFDRKAPRLFVKDRLLRLGIPFLVYLFVLSPVTQYIASPEKLHFWLFYKTKILTLQNIETGPLWFAEVLLIFTLIYVLYRVLLKKSGFKAEQPFPSSRKLLFTALLLGIGTFLVRLVFPIGFWIWGFQIAYLPSYLFLFYIGIVAGRKSWLYTIPRKTTKQWIWCLSIVTPLFPLSLIFFQGNINGGFNFKAFTYAIWEPLVAFGICLGLLAVFRKYANQTGAIWKTLSRSAFAVYIIHPVVLVGYAMLLKSIDLQPLLKFTIVGFAGTITCFLIATIIVKIPYVNKIV
ncbi:acyltransferase family protein [Shimazuella kribbensis]|uniref:acyltransferase family protein n=1 Tax=Shimazuella kribbensis TaxID=139808 RepID=UPI000414F43D|nr:acyltransferase [Shimazuella kribbensis]